MAPPGGHIWTPSGLPSKIWPEGYGAAHYSWVLRKRRSLYSDRHPQRSVVHLQALGQKQSGLWGGDGEGDFCPRRRPNWIPSKPPLRRHHFHLRPVILAATCPGREKWHYHQVYPSVQGYQHPSPSNGAAYCSRWHHSDTQWLKTRYHIWCKSTCSHEQRARAI